MAYRILIVDDSPVMRSFVKRILDISGFPYSTCLEAGNGVEALRVLRSQPPDVMLTDINMPEMDGESLVREMEQDPSLRSIPIVVISTDGTSQRVRQMLSLGAIGYVTKPFYPETLRNELERVMGEANA